MTLTLEPKTSLDTEKLDRLITQWLEEDMPSGDITTDSLFTQAKQCTGIISSQQPLVVSGLHAAKRVFERLDPNMVFDALVDDGDCLSSNSDMVKLSGDLNSILKAERLALNLLQHLCGIATLTYQYASTVALTKAKILHTRKTLPGLRFLETQAVVNGGGYFHRQSLSEFVMLKDNHIAAAGGNLIQAVQTLRDNLPADKQNVKIEIECDRLEQVEQALKAGVDVILLDNMSLDMLRQAVKLVNGKALTEASGGVSLKTVRQIAETDVDFISTSQITLSAPAADIHLELS